MLRNQKEVLADFEAGEYDVLCNSMLLTEGWDCPAVDTIVVLRPTKVRSLYQQMVGRGMRLFPGKKELLLLDFLWMTERHDLCRPSALISKNDDIANRIDKMMMNNESGINLLDAEEQAGRDIVQERVDFLYDFLDKHGLKVDKQNRNPSRLSRLPGVTRNGKQQTLLATNIGRKSWNDCQTPFVTEDEVKSKFILAYNEFIGNREQLIEDCKEMIQVLDNTEELESKLAELNQKAEDIIVLVKNLIDQNSTEVMDQDDFQKKYDSYDLEHKKVINEIEAVGLEIEKKNAQAKYLQAFIDDLNNRPNILEAYDEDVWSYLIDKAIVNRDKSITFQFRNGKEIKII